MFSLSQTFESEHQEICVQKSSEFCSSLTSLTLKSICESKKNSAVTCSSASFISQKSSTSRSVFKKSCSICRINVSSIQEHYLESSSCHEALRHRLEQQLARRAHQREQEAQKQAEVEKAISQLVKDSHLSVKTVNLVCEIEKTSFASHKSESTKRSTTCRRCNQIFNFNNKLHEHIRQYHARKSVKSSDLRVLASESRYKTAEKSAITCSTASHASSIFSATSRSQIFSTKMSSRSVFFKDSHLSIATLKITSKSLKKLSVNCSLTSSLSSSRTSIRKHQEFHMQKSYLIMNDLSRMFDEKSKSFDLQQYQNRALSSRSFDIRQSHSIKSHLTIENLFEMFNEKCRKKSLFQSQKNVSSREFFSKQSRIIAYFKSAINRKSSISQISKSSKTKSLKQLISAKSIRTAFTKCSEKSIISSYKMSDIFCSSSMINCFKNEVFEISYALKIPSRQFRSSSFSDLSRCCRICCDQFSSNNDLYRHSRMSSANHTSRQSMRMIN